MMNTKELKKNALNSLKGRYINAIGASLIVWLMAAANIVLVILAVILVIYFMTAAIIPLVILEAASRTAEAINGSGHIFGIAMEQASANAGILFLMMWFISAAVTFITIAGFLFIAGPAEVGLKRFFIFDSNRKIGILNIFWGFKKYGRNFKIQLLRIVKNILWSCLFVIPGIVKFFEYAMIPYILAENTSLCTKEVFQISKSIMKGRKIKYFLLNLSFIGWIILSFFTLGVGFIFLIPYMEAANAEFYKEASQN